MGLLEITKPALQDGIELTDDGLQTVDLQLRAGIRSSLNKPEFEKRYPPCYSRQMTAVRRLLERAARDDRRYRLLLRAGSRH